MILIIDNYDSFTYNLLHYMGELGAEIEVFRNDKITVEQIKELRSVEGIVLSPGPCTPDQAGICLDIVEQFSRKIPILGVCLGHQTIGQSFGGNIVRGDEPVHGKVHQIHNSGKRIFRNIPDTFKVTRYHSLIIEKDTLPNCFEITAETQDGVIMGVSHKEYEVHGVQFHPESIASEYGHEILQNFIDISKNNH